MIVYYIIISLLSLTTIIVTYIAKIQRIKSLKYKEMYESAIDNLNEIESSVESVLITMKNIDSSGAFESDDEVGLIFKSLKTILFKHFNTFVDDESKEK